MSDTGLYYEPGKLMHYSIMFIYCDMCKTKEVHEVDCVFSVIDGVKPIVKGVTCNRCNTEFIISFGYESPVYRGNKNER